MLTLLLYNHNTLTNPTTIPKLNMFYVIVTSILQKYVTDLVVPINTVQPGTWEHKRYHKGAHAELGRKQGSEQIWCINDLKMPI